MSYDMGQVFSGPPSRPNIRRGYQFSLVNYIPRRGDRRQICIGVIVHDLESGQARFRYTQDFSRVYAVEPDSRLDGIQLMLEVLSGNISFSTRQDGLWAGVVHAQGEDGPMLVYTDIKDGVRAPKQSVESLVEDLFNRYVA